MSPPEQRRDHRSSKSATGDQKTRTWSRRWSPSLIPDHRCPVSGRLSPDEEIGMAEGEAMGEGGEMDLVTGTVAVRVVVDEAVERVVDDPVGGIMGMGALEEGG